MADLERMIVEVRQWRRIHKAARHLIDASACGIREKALLDARAAFIGRVEPGYEFKSQI